MKKIFIIIIIVGYPFFEIFSINRIDSLLKILDHTISKRALYEGIKREDIQELEQKKSELQELRSIYYINNNIISQYQSFICDSAEHYIHENILLAQKIGDDDLVNESKLELAFVYSLSGLFVQANGILTSIEYQKLPVYLKCKYCWTFIRYYENLIKYTDDKQYSDQYNREINIYRQEVISLLDKASDEYLKEYAFQMQEAGNYRESLKILIPSFQEKEPETHMYAMAAMSLAKVYALAGNTEEENYYLALAAITDTQLAVKENEALLSLATNLYDNGNTDRAYNYIKVALEDANFFNSRFKNSVIARVQPIIENTYLQKIEQQKYNLRLYAVFITVIVIALVIAMYFNYSQKKIILKTRENLVRKNEELVELNKQLDEASKIKEKYIGYFINQSSVYIDKLERYRKDVNLKIKAGLVNELYKSSSSSIFEKELEEIYTNFDKAFLELYPDFVEKFNLLLKPDKRFNLPKKQLNAELRIFALIRLGITDVAQIALQLRLSTQTIYNYRSKVKKNSIVEGDVFEEQVKKIGSLS